MLCDICRNDVFIIYRFEMKGGGTLMLCPACKDKEQYLKEYREKWEGKDDSKRKSN